MITKSIRLQLGLITGLFFIFVTVVLFQIWYTRSLQKSELKRLEESHAIVSEYLECEAEEREIIDTFRIFKENPTLVEDPQQLDKLAKAIDKWGMRITEWTKGLRTWQNENSLELKDVFSGSFAREKERQKDGYSEALDLCRKNSETYIIEARHLAKIEEGYIPAIDTSVRSLLKGIRAQLKKNQDDSKRFYFGTAFAVLLALVALVWASISIFRNLNKSLGVLEGGAQRITHGDLSQEIDLKNPVELSQLADAFNEMQQAIRSRDEEIRRDHEEIRKLNKVLEQKVEDRNKTIVHQNVALKRKNQELEQILYAASHDLRTPLISIQGFSQELRQACIALETQLQNPQMMSPEQVKEIVDEDVNVALNYILNGAQRMEVLLEGLLRLSRMGRESLQLRELDMNSLLQSIVDSVSFQLNEANGKLDIEDLPPCQGDQSMVEQVFSNLINNAIKYRSQERDCAIRVYAEKTEDATRYFVQDNGIGIPPEYQDRVFHAFFRVDDEVAEGDGVGLAIVNRALDLHGGRAWVEKTGEEGTTFGIEVPDNVANEIELT